MPSTLKQEMPVETVLRVYSVIIDKQQLLATRRMRRNQTKGVQKWT
jgi:hypothetical protein